MEIKWEMNIYETSDIALASYLYCSGAAITKVDNQNPRRCIFVFSLTKPEVLSLWQEGRAMVNALAYYNAYQALKAKIFRGGS
ncbi:MAG: DUF5659 domain-containing protein [Dehalococcoidia bacterium]|jgi:hypothetical protein